MVKKKVGELKPFIKTLLPARFNDMVEYDELWSFIGGKENRVWIWIALCRRTKQVVAFHFSNRDKESFLEFYLKVPIEYANCLSRSDGLRAYNIMTNYGHKMCKKKNRETSQVEAFNTILRQRLARLVRRTCAFSKDIEMHKGIIRWFIQDYNESILSVGL